MSSGTPFRSALLALSFALVPAAFADSNHARIIRLSVVEGDVRFAREVHGDPLADPKANWETAELNLPVRQGYVLATDAGRAAVEFESGAMAFLAHNTVLEFYDLSLEDGAKITRLVLRQGTASFYVNPADGDYFSVTGGDFTVEATDRANFRVDNFDDGSAVDVMKGHVSVRRKEQTTRLVKGQSFSMRASDDASMNVGSLPGGDDFDRWVSASIENVEAATNAARQYVNSPYYTAGLADLYNYGAWYPVAGYGRCWRPYGVGQGWSPFDNGGWYMDPIFGWSFVGGQPWGWLPYHFGGWVFDPVFGWLWSPGAFGFGFAPWRPVTGVWVKSKPGLLGIVPVHPLDVRGKTPINLSQGVFPVSGGAVGRSVPVELSSTGDRWKPIKSVPRETLSTNLVASTAPTHVTRTSVSSPAVTAPVARPTAGNNSSIAYDPREHTFVNANSKDHVEARTVTSVPTVAGAAAVNNPASPQRVQVPAVPSRSITVYSPRAITPPPAPRTAYSPHVSVGTLGGAGAYERSAHASATGSAGSHSTSTSSGGGAASHSGSSGHSH